MGGAVNLNNLMNNQYQNHNQYGSQPTSYTNSKGSQNRTMGSPPPASDVLAPDAGDTVDEQLYDVKAI